MIKVETGDYMKSNRNAFFQLMVMLLLTFISQIIALLKSSKTAAIFGVSASMDVYNFINSIATFIFSFLGAGVATVLIPAFAKKHVKNKAINCFITVLYGVALIIIGIFIFQSKLIFKVFTDYTEEYFVLACSLVGVVMLSQFSNSINNIFISYLQCKNIFNFPKVIGALTTGAITLTVFIIDELTIYKYACYTLLFLFLETFLLAIYAIYKGFRYKPNFDLHNSEFKNIMNVFFPTLWGSGVYQVTLLTDSLVSSSLGTGNLSILTYSNTISGMLNTIICANVVSYAYPRIASESDDENCKKKLFHYLIFFAFLMCALIIAFLAGGQDVIRILFERGEFNTSATKSVYICVLIYLLGYPFNIMRDVMYRYFYSKGNTKGTFYNGFFASVLNIIISIVLSKFMGLYGIVLGTTITAIFSFTTILLRFSHEYSFNGCFIPFFTEIIKLLISTIMSCFICVIIKTILPLDCSLLSSIIAAIISLIVYVFMLLILRSKFYKVEF